ncbi:MAG: DUF4833 domain-containing protein [Bdellovibrionota bacterium]
MVRPSFPFFFCCVLLAARAAIAAEPLFLIDRSLNRNQVVYEANVTTHGWDEDDPIRVYWILHEDEGRVEPLSGIEQSFAYGISVRKQTEQELRFVLKALPKKEITVLQQSPGKFIALTEIAGAQAVIKSIFIKTVGSGIFSSVRYIEVSGHSVSDEQIRVERIVPKKSFG